MRWDTKLAVVQFDIRLLMTLLLMEAGVLRGVVCGTWFWKTEVAVNPVTRGYGRLTRCVTDCVHAARKKSWLQTNPPTCKVLPVPRAWKTRIVKHLYKREAAKEYSKCLDVEERLA